MHVIIELGLLYCVYGSVGYDSVDHLDPATLYLDSLGVCSKSLVGVSGASCGIQPLAQPASRINLEHHRNSETQR